VDIGYDAGRRARQIGQLAIEVFAIILAVFALPKICLRSRRFRPTIGVMMSFAYLPQTRKGLRVRAEGEVEHVDLGIGRDHLLGNQHGYLVMGGGPAAHPAFAAHGCENARNVADSAGSW
jgi:hypothetical protein